MSEPTTLEEMKEMVEIPKKNYTVGKYLVTQALWESVKGNNPSRFKGSSRPVEKVNWFDCVEFCNKLSEKEGLENAYTINGEDVQCNFDSNGYRLPTEEEREFAAKANQDFEYAGSDNIDEVAWYRENSNKKTHPVGQKKENGFALYDMSGNVWEWCWLEDISYGVFSGGCWCSIESDASVSYFFKSDASIRAYDLGFRLFRTTR